MLLTNKAFLFYNNQNQNKEFAMKCNVGKTDRMLRAIAGVAVIILGVIFNKLAISRLPSQATINKVAQSCNIVDISMQPHKPNDK